MRHKAISKYRAKRVADSGYLFASKLEHRRYCELRLLEKAGEIRGLMVHPRYEIIWPGETKRICIVELDFLYTDKKGDIHNEDVKGKDTAMSNLKRKLLKAATGIVVEIVK